jgi:hypothetical protein
VQRQARAFLLPDQGAGVLEAHQVETSPRFCLARQGQALVRDARSGWRLCGKALLIKLGNNPEIAPTLSTTRPCDAQFGSQSDAKFGPETGDRTKQKDRAMTDNLTIMARARRLRALAALEGPRRLRPSKASFFTVSRKPRHNREAAV